MRMTGWIPVLLIAVALVPATLAHDEDPPNLLGRCNTTQLDEVPFREWFREEFDNYAPNPAIVDGLRGTTTDDLRFTIFFGTWCGDSRREVPRMLKLFESLDLSDHVELVALDRAPDALKQSPDGEERGREIYRVPTLIVERDGAEVARLIEHPVLSIERDLLEILDGSGYSPAYAAYPIVRDWLELGLLDDPNVSAWGLAKLLRPRINGPGDLAAAARVLQSRGDLEPAIKLFEVNCALHWDDSSSHARLSEALLERGDRKRARKSADLALRYNTDSARLADLTELIRRTDITEPGDPE